MACEGGACGSRGVMFSSDVDFTPTNAYQGARGGNRGYQTAAFQTMGAGQPPAIQTTNQCGQGVLLEGRYKQMTVSCPTRTPYTYRVQVPKKSFKAVPVQTAETYMTTEQKLVPYVERQQRVRKVKRKVKKPVVKWETVTVTEPITEVINVRKYKTMSRQVPRTRTKTNYVTQAQTTMTTELRTGYRQGSKPCVVNVPEYIPKCSGVVTNSTYPADVPATSYAPANTSYAYPETSYPTNTSYAYPSAENYASQPLAATSWPAPAWPATAAPVQATRARRGGKSVEDHQTKFSDLDTDGDGMISRAELQAAGGLGFQ